ncbi:MAG: YceH family protein [Paludibacterium sp.]|uniref:YceH family protein n=1 Tax=Paludibacterium sp. TaxID=1917523 RepID=UPI0025F019C4|nr:YceH family protein [Paludibacterium sp.]MBV8048927.1 YceH family protein [Paludibacterium sp.]MBV8647799.1 YceH family protein [Paludibacterium sp.]
MDGYQLNPVEVRVLGALIEKQALTPDTYPLTLNALTAACNQLTSREPVMQLTDSDILATLDSLAAQKLIAERTPAGSRVAKYEHRLNYEWHLDGARLAALAILMLRGAQTAAEIRARSGRLHAFSSGEEVETALSALADKYPPMVVKLARQPGAREARWAHLLSGEPQQIVEECREIDIGLAGRVAALEAQVEALKTRLVALETRLDE